MKLLGIDYGTKYIGLSYADTSNSVVLPLETISSISQDKAVESIKTIIEEKVVDRVVVGLPLNFKMEETEMSKEIRKFADNLHRQTGVEVVFMNEVLTTDLARRLTQNGLKDDAVSAQLILKDYLLKYHKD